MAGRRRYTCAVCLVFLSLDLCNAFESCQTLSSEIVITKEKTSVIDGRPVRLLCVGTVTVKKCEGTCLSQVSPSVVKFPGFLKDCRCCRESTLEERLVSLHKCYGPDGLEPPVYGEHMNMYIKEPADCECFTCTH